MSITFMLCSCQAIKILQKLNHYNIASQNQQQKMSNILNNNFTIIISSTMVSVQCTTQFSSSSNNNNNKHKNINLPAVNNASHQLLIENQTKKLWSSQWKSRRKFIFIQMKNPFIRLDQDQKKGFSGWLRKEVGAGLSSTFYMISKKNPCYFLMEWQNSSRDQPPRKRWFTGWLKTQLIN